MGSFRKVNPDSCGVLCLAAFHGLMQFMKFESTILDYAPHKEIYCRAVDHLLSGLSVT